MSRPTSASVELNAFADLAQILCEQLLIFQYGGGEGGVLVAFAAVDEVFDIETVHLSLDKAGDSFSIRLISESGAIQKRFRADELRSRDPQSGALVDGGHHEVEISSQAGKRKAANLKPTRAEKKGRYGYAVHWADGATIIYSNRCIVMAAGGTLIQEHR